MRRRQPGPQSDVFYDFDISADDEKQKLAPTSGPDSTKSLPDSSAVCCIVLFIVALVALMIFSATKLYATNTASLDDTAMFAATLSSPEHCPAAVAVNLPASLDAIRAGVLAIASLAPAISWATYASDPAAHAGRRVLLTQQDFAAGTLRITTTGTFAFVENVTFAPNAAHDFRPNLPAQAALYGGDAYKLGFFAAIAVEAANVVIDLQGHVLDASAVFCAEQKFYAHISVADQPFLSVDGPTNFGNVNVAADGLVIENGTLGLTPHHGIHGNGARRVLVQDLVLREYEVAAIALNGASDVVLRRVQARGSSRRVAVLATYSQARILLLMAQRLVASTDAAAAEARTLVQAAVGPLAELVGQVRSDIATLGRINAVAHPAAAALFANAAGMSDGNAYGILFHPLGAAVQGFWHLTTPPAGADFASERLFLQDVSVNGTQSRIVEVVALVAPNGAPVRGPAGDVVRIRDNIDRIRLYDGADTGAGAYNGGNALSRAQVRAFGRSTTIAALTRIGCIYCRCPGL